MLDARYGPYGWQCACGHVLSDAEGRQVARLQDEMDADIDDRAAAEMESDE